MDAQFLHTGFTTFKLESCFEDNRINVKFHLQIDSVNMIESSFNIDI